MDTEIDDRVAFSKLQTINEIRRGQSAMERLRSRLLTELETADAEGRSLAEYRRELDLLLQEKMAHVEELRQIHADINAIEEVVRQSEQARSAAQQSARRLYGEYAPLKCRLDRLRQQLGLTPLTEIADCEPELPVNQLLEQCVQSAELHVRPDLAADAPVVGAAGLPPAWAAVSAVGGSAGGVQPGAALAALRAAKQELPRGAPPSGLQPGVPSPTAFRQQPPPMKACLSCHQQIHRNAPICPLCKAKSRSRNPKKPKQRKE